VLGVLAARDLDHAVELQNATAFGLTGGLHSLDPDEIERWLDRVEVGNAYVNRTTTGAIVRRQPFGGWKRSTVGPAAKAGGPGYVMSLCSWQDRPGRRLDRARASYPAAWAALSRPDDPSGLAAERNELRSRPLPRVLLRIEHDADPVDVELCRLAATTVGVALVISDARDEAPSALVRRVPDELIGRIRVVGSVPALLWQVAADSWIHLDDRPPVADGRIELRRWSREQSVTMTAHRHGSPVHRRGRPAASAGAGARERGE
jgi:RHH-type proline utilization regulon transcriptional repressor/proline dehydrogenase/delta 1-pyrroline-5-carboxylate dehydrogenase